MTNEKMIGTLEKFGLSNNESKVYLASLELGLSRVNAISKKAGIIRETTYGIINSLIQKGLMSSVIKSGVRYFEAADPAKLKQILKEKEEMVNRILPNLVKLKELKIVKPKVEFYEGKEGLKTIMEDLLTAKDGLRAMVPNKSLRKIFRFYFPHLIKRREKLCITVRLLSDEKPISKKLIKSKILPKDFEFNTSTWIYNDKVAMISLSQKEPIGLIIQDKEIFKTQKNTFELLWKLIK